MRGAVVALVAALLGACGGWWAASAAATATALQLSSSDVDCAFPASGGEPQGVVGGCAAGCGRASPDAAVALSCEVLAREFACSGRGLRHPVTRECLCHAGWGGPLCSDGVEGGGGGGAIATLFAPVVPLDDGKGVFVSAGGGGGGVAGWRGFCIGTVGTEEEEEEVDGCERVQACLGPGEGCQPLAAVLDGTAAGTHVHLLALRLGGGAELDVLREFPFGGRVKVDVISVEVDARRHAAVAQLLAAYGFASIGLGEHQRDALFASEGFTARLAKRPELYHYVVS